MEKMCIRDRIYGAGKTAEQIAGIVEAMKKRGQELVLILSLIHISSTGSMCGDSQSIDPPV